MNLCEVWINPSLWLTDLTLGLCSPVARAVYLELIGYRPRLSIQTKNIHHLCNASSDEMDGARRELESIGLVDENGFLKRVKSVRFSHIRPPIPIDIRNEVQTRDGNKCVKCKSTGELQFDHVFPYSEGGGDTAENLQLLCGVCNRKKSNRK